MSNLDLDPPELTIEDEPGLSSAVQVLGWRDVPLGGPRAMTVRRSLPQRGRSLIGAWCFVDHYGPDNVAVTGGMTVPPHPHTGLQTVSWLFTGEIEHRDSTGAHAMVRPGELNLMTAGRGVQHSEVSTSDTSVLHGVQLWTVMPDRSRHGAPFFERFVPAAFDFQGATIRVFLGKLLGVTSPATAFTPLVGAEVIVPPNTLITVPVDPTFEHGVLVDSGSAEADGVAVTRSEIGYLAAGSESISIRSGSDGARIVLIGGVPFGEQIVMWWNFIGRSHDEVVEYRRRWEIEVIEERMPDGWFGEVAGYDGDPLPAPTLPTVRLKPRG